ncbi:hypothetical protein F5Y07DRAFT_393578 [Xylaria sp. FL0933]|nr:hypothetical protein F5Y07DRAFT_393578 [Xylaria sp. FL0933]
MDICIRTLRAAIEASLLAQATGKYHRGSSQMEEIDYISYGHSRLGSRAPLYSNGPRLGADYHSSHVQSRQSLERTAYDGYGTRISYNGGHRPENDEISIDQYRNLTTYHEWETRRFLPVSPIHGILPSHAHLQIADKILSFHSTHVDHYHGLWHVENILPADSSGRYGTATNKSDSQSYISGNEESSQQKQGRGVCYERDSSASEEPSADEESQYSWEIDDYSHDSRDFIHFDDENEEDPDQYASDGGFDEDGEPDDGFDDDDDDDY